MTGIGVGVFIVLSDNSSFKLFIYSFVVEDSPHKWLTPRIKVTREDRVVFLPCGHRVDFEHCPEDDVSQCSICFEPLAGAAKLNAS